MLHLLSLEYKKFKNSAVISLFGIMFLATMPTVIFFGKELNVPPPLPSNLIYYRFPSMWEYLGYTTNWLVFFFLGFIVIHMITSEVSFKTLRQNIITGMTRNQYFLSKLYAIIFLSAFATLFYFIIGMIIGFVHNSPVSFHGAFDTPVVFLKVFVMSMGYMSFALMLAFLLRRSGIVIFFYFIYIIFLEIMMKWGFYWKVHQTPLVNYLPMNSVEDLMPFPIWKMAQFLPIDGVDLEDFLLTDTEALISSSVWIIIFLSVAYFSFTKKDI